MVLLVFMTNFVKGLLAFGWHHSGLSNNEGQLQTGVNDLVKRIMITPHRPAQAAPEPLPAARFTMPAILNPFASLEGFNLVEILREFRPGR
jgi:hypothetical protein